ncbi:MAG: nitrogenase component 1 [Euryarchaeota archaeon]|nr:MAG: Light-independent protochlorophyllide reductase subunit B [ANME-2 cluster archaeon]MEA1863905.1 nitrogenase component 1 [Euryarchaeota archaeon]
MYAERDSGMDLMIGRMWLMHRSAIHCKLSGGVCAATEIADAVPIIHGPIGCAYNHRIPVQKSWLDTAALPTTALTDNETVFGGGDRLRDTILEVDQNYHPNLILVLLSCVSGIIGDDVKGEIFHLKNTDQVTADIVVADTSGFKHRDFRDWVETAIKNVIHNYKNPEDYKPFPVEGCGQVEVLTALAGQLMEDPDTNGGVIEHGVNLCGGNRTWDVGALGEKIDILTEIGATINTVFFANLTTEKIKNAPRAELNIVQRPGDWVKIMQERFGTDAVHENIFSVRSLPYPERIRAFYTQIGEKLGLEKETEAVIDRRLAKLEKNLEPYREKLDGKHMVMLRGSGMFGGAHEIISLVLDLGMVVDAISLDYSFLYDKNLSQDVLDQHRAVTVEIFHKMGVDSDVLLETSMEKEESVLKEFKPDIVVTTPERKWVPHSLGIPAYSREVHRFLGQFENVLGTAEELCTELNRKNLAVKRPYIFQALEYDPVRYPYTKKSSASIRAGEAMQFVKRSRSGAGGKA